MPNVIFKKKIRNRRYLGNSIRIKNYFKNRLSTTKIIWDKRDPNKIRYFYEPKGLKACRCLTQKRPVKKFIEDYKDYFGIDVENLKDHKTWQTAEINTYRFSQQYKGVPVYKAYVSLNIHKRRDAIYSMFNSYDFFIEMDISNIELKPTIKKKEAENLTKDFLEKGFKSAECKAKRVYLYRFMGPEKKPDFKHKSTDIQHKLKLVFEELDGSISTTPKYTLFLAWQVIAVVKDPFITCFEVMINAADGKIISYSDQTAYNEGWGRIYEPDPTTVSRNALQSSSTESVLDPPVAFFNETERVLLQRLDDPVNDMYTLTGKYCSVIDIPYQDVPILPQLFPGAVPPVSVVTQVSTAIGSVDPKPDFGPADFNQLANFLRFYEVMAYYWIDFAQNYIQTVLKIYDAGNYDIQIDPHGLPDWMDNACFMGGIIFEEPANFGNPRFLPGLVEKAVRRYIFSSCCIQDPRGSILLGLGGDNPEPADAAVILHEYGHAIQFNQRFPWGDAKGCLTEGFADTFAKIILDRFNPNNILRDEILPFENNPNNADHNDRRNVGLTDKIDNRILAFGSYEQGDIWASTVWNMYLALGGGSNNLDIRNWAADLILRLYILSNDLFGSADLRDRNSIEQMYVTATKLMEADGVNEAWTNFDGYGNESIIPTGICRKVIEDKCINRDLFPVLETDVYIGNDQYEESNRIDTYTDCQDIRVRKDNMDPSPTYTHQQPSRSNNPNYVWVKVQRKGAREPDVDKTFVHVYYTENMVGTHWNNDFKKATPNNKSINWNGNTEVWIGPFAIEAKGNNISIIAIVDETIDRAFAIRQLNEAVPLHQFVMLDNNIAQRDVTTDP